MKLTISTVVFLLAQLGCQFGSADVVDTNWWSNQTSFSNVVESVGPEEIRLANLQTTGFLEGVVNLPFDSAWQIDFKLRSDETNAIPGEFVDTFVDGIFVDRIYNTPVDTNFEFSHSITGTSFGYRFEFASDTSSPLNTHMVVANGSASSIPEPNSVALLVIVAAGCSLVRSRSRRIKCSSDSASRNQHSVLFKKVP